jgi:hypothetical protein
MIFVLPKGRNFSEIQVPFVIGWRTARSDLFCYVNKSYTSVGCMFCHETSGPHANTASNSLFSRYFHFIHHINVWSLTTLVAIQISIWMLKVRKFLERREKRTDLHFGVHTGMRLLNINAIHLPPCHCEVRSLCGFMLLTINVVLCLSCFISFLTAMSTTRRIRTGIWQNPKCVPSSWRLRFSVTTDVAVADVKIIYKLCLSPSLHQNYSARISDLASVLQ